MRVRVIGGTGSELPGSDLTAFLIDGRVMLDAGTISSRLRPAELLKITHVVLSHAHLDHSKGIPFMLDNVMGRPGGPVVVAADGRVVDILKTHLFNGLLWPDFTKIPSPKAPVLKFKRLAPGKTAGLAHGLAVRPYGVNHTVPTTGFIITKGEKALVYSGDTNTTDGLWRAARGLGKRLKAVLVETSFPNRMQATADKSGHLTPRTLGLELGKLGGYDGPVYVYHVKAPYRREISREIAALGNRKVKLVRDGMEFSV